MAIYKVSTKELYQYYSDEVSLQAEVKFPLIIKEHLPILLKYFNPAFSKKQNYDSFTGRIDSQTINNITLRPKAFNYKPISYTPQFFNDNKETINKFLDSFRNSSDDMALVVAIARYYTKWDSHVGKQFSSFEHYSEPLDFKNPNTLVYHSVVNNIFNANSLEPNSLVEINFGNENEKPIHPSENLESIAQLLSLPFLDLEEIYINTDSSESILDKIFTTYEKVSFNALPEKVINHSEHLFNLSAFKSFRAEQEKKREIDIAKNSAKNKNSSQSENESSQVEKDNDEFHAQLASNLLSDDELIERLFFFSESPTNDTPFQEINRPPDAYMKNSSFHTEEQFQNKNINKNQINGNLVDSTILEVFKRIGNPIFFEKFIATSAKNCDDFLNSSSFNLEHIRKQDILFSLAFKNKDFQNSLVQNWDIFSKYFDDKKITSLLFLQTQSKKNPIYIANNFVSQNYYIDDIHKVFLEQQEVLNTVNTSNVPQNFKNISFVPWNNSGKVLGNDVFIATKFEEAFVSFLNKLDNGKKEYFQEFKGISNLLLWESLSFLKNKTKMNPHFLDSLDTSVLRYDLANPKFQLPVILLDNPKYYSMIMDLTLSSPNFRNLMPKEETYLLNFFEYNLNRQLTNFAENKPIDYSFFKAPNNTSNKSFIKEFNRILDDNPSLPLFLTHSFCQTLSSNSHHSLINACLRLSMIHLNYDTKPEFYQLMHKNQADFFTTIFHSSDRRMHFQDSVTSYLVQYMNANNIPVENPEIHRFFTKLCDSFVEKSLKQPNSQNTPQHSLIFQGKQELMTLLHDNKNIQYLLKSFRCSRSIHYKDNSSKYPDELYDFLLDKIGVNTLYIYDAIPRGIVTPDFFKDMIYNQTYKTSVDKADEMFQNLQIRESELFYNFEINNLMLDTVLNTSLSSGQKEMASRWLNKTPLSFFFQEKNLFKISKFQTLYGGSPDDDDESSDKHPEEVTDSINILYDIIRKKGESLLETLQILRSENQSQALTEFFMQRDQDFRNKHTVAVKAKIAKF